MQQQFEHLVSGEYHFVHVCGLGNSGPEHWMTNWEARFPNTFSRVNQLNWEVPFKDEWVESLNWHIQSLPHAKIILIGHSMGCATIMHFMHNENFYSSKIVGSFLVGPADVQGNQLPASCRSFFPFPIKCNSKPIELIISDNDMYIDLKTAIDYAEIWGAKYTLLQNQGHFCSTEEFKTWKNGLKMLNSFCNYIANTTELQ